MTSLPNRDHITQMVIEELSKHIAAEPPQDAGMHPSDSVHEEFGKRWKEWADAKRAYESILAPRLIREALEASK